MGDKLSHLDNTRKPGFSNLLKVVLNCQKNVLCGKLEPYNGRKALRPYIRI